MSGPSPNVVLIDARTDLAEARATCRMLHATGSGVPLLAVVTECRPDRAQRRLGRRRRRPGHGRPGRDRGPAAPRGRPARRTRPSADAATIRVGELTIDPDTYAAELKGRPLDLTYKEFELLKFLAQHPGRVFTRDQLLREVWGYDYFGGTRTVDVHVRRLRAKLGSEYESMIGTVRQVGYKFVVPSARGIDRTPGADPELDVADPTDVDHPADQLLA